LVDSEECDEDDPPHGSASGAGKEGSAKDGELSGTASGKKVAEDHWDGDEDDTKKAEFSDSERKDLASHGQAQSDGSYPIRNKADLHNAIQDFGRSKDKGKTKAWIVRRARALGATSMLPDSWSVSKEDPVIDQEEGGTVETHEVPVRKEDGSWDLSGVPDESRPFYEAMIQKADETAAELEKTKVQLAKADDSLLTRTILEKAARLSHVAPTDELAPVLKEASQVLSEESFQKLEQILATAEERVSKGDLFTEYGRNGYGEQKPESGAYEQLLAKADEMIEKGADISKVEAFDRALRSNPELYNQYMAEQGMGVS
jgi:hypothetical protein